MKVSSSFSGLSAVLLLLFSSMVSAVTLPFEVRLGGLAYYDPNLDITWTADANINGTDNWVNHTAWAASLNIAGVTGWRLPSVDVNGDTTIVNCFGGGVVGCSDNEMGYLYYEEGISASTPGPFTNVVAGTESNGAPSSYWSSTENFVGSNSARTFEFGLGGNGSGHITLNDYTYAWAVRSGDVRVVPVPAALWLFGSGLMLLASFTRRKI